VCVVNAILNRLSDKLETRHAGSLSVRSSQGHILHTVRKNVVIGASRQCILQERGFRLRPSQQKGMGQMRDFRGRFSRHARPMVLSIVSCVCIYVGLCRPMFVRL